MTAPFEKVPPQDKFANVISSMRRELEELSNGIRRTPVFDADPVDKRINLWFLSDGRLRGRHPQTGAIFEYATTTAGSGTSTTPRTAVAARRALVTATYTASWQATYNDNGTQNNATRSYIGNTTGTAGNLQALIGLPADMVNSLLGKTPTQVEVNFSVQSNQNNIVGVPFYYANETMSAGVFTPISATTPPSNYPSSYNSVDSSNPRITYRAIGENTWVNLTSGALLNALSAGKALAFAIPPSAVGLTNYAEISGPNSPGNIPFQIRVTYFQ